MATWKKVLIGIGIVLVLCGICFCAGFYTCSKSASKERVEAKRVAIELETARSELAGLREQNKDIGSKLDRAIQDNTRLTNRVDQLAEANRRLEVGLDKLRESIDRGAEELAAIGNEISDARRTVAKCIQLVLDLQEASGE